MKGIFFISCLFVSLYSNCQTDTGFVSDNRNSWRFFAGYFYPAPLQYRNPIGTTFHRFFPDPKQVFSVAVEHPRGYGKKNACGEMGINFYCPQTIRPGDTTKLTWFANNFFYSAKFDAFPRNKYIDLFGCLGFAIGSQRILVNNGLTAISRNFFAAIYPKIELRMQAHKRISVGADAAYFLEGTGTSWRTGRGHSYLLDECRFNGLLVNIYVGYCFGH